MEELGSMFVVAPEIQHALDRNQPVVALETTLIAHGIPRPRNLELAMALEETIRANGATPATIGVINGKAVVGLNASEIKKLAVSSDAVKCSTRDLAGVMAKGGLGATTIASTIYLARRAGIRFMATGGLGGVHPGGENSLDISADLIELARSPLMIVCSGPKIILDLARTAEVLETQGIAVFGYKCSKLPGFYVQSTDLDVPVLDNLADIGALLKAQDALGWPGSIILANPPPEDYAFQRQEIERILSDAARQAVLQRVQGKQLTPFLLAKIAESTGGRSVELNCALVMQNAQLAARASRANHF